MESHKLQLNYHQMLAVADAPSFPYTWRINNVSANTETKLNKLRVCKFGYVLGTFYMELLD